MQYHRRLCRPPSPCGYCRRYRLRRQLDVNNHHPVRVDQAYSKVFWPDPWHLEGPCFLVNSFPESFGKGDAMLFVTTTTTTTVQNMAVLHLSNLLKEPQP